MTIENKFKKERIKKLPWPEMENCFLFVSGAMRKQNRYGIEPRITFAYVRKNVAAEWDGHYGRIQLWFKCDKDDIIEYETVREHWIFDYAYGTDYCSQCAVEDNDLPTAFNNGDFERIFRVLKSFVDDREKINED